MNTGIAEEIRKQWLIDGTALVARLNSGANELHVAGAIVGAGIMVILRDEIGSGRFDAKESDQFQQLREELEQMRENANAWERKADAQAAELEQVKNERDKLVDEVKFQVERNDKQRAAYFEIESQLAEKNKVLEWYGEEMPHAGSITSKALIDKGQKARSILSQYATINESKPEPDTAPGFA